MIGVSIIVDFNHLFCFKYFSFSWFFFLCACITSSVRPAVCHSLRVEMKAFFYALIILRIVHLHLAYLEKEEWYTRIIALKQGDVRGKVVKLKKNVFLQEVEVYLGIPYAAPPVNSLRFMPPGAPPRWSETLNAFNMKPACPQMFPDLDHTVTSTSKLSPDRNIFIRKLKQFLKSESEDCLYLNIYVPHESDRKFIDEIIT